MQRLIYNSEQKRTKLINGITQVDLDVDGEITKLGTVLQAPDSNKFSAFLTDGSLLSDGHATKKQAGGALKKLHDGGEKVVAKVKAAIPSLPLSGPKQKTDVDKRRNAAAKKIIEGMDEAPKPAAVTEVTETAATPVEEHPDLGKMVEEDEMIPDATIHAPVPVLDSEWVLDATTEALLEIPSFLKRTATLQEEV